MNEIYNDSVWKFVFYQLGYGGFSAAWSSTDADNVWSPVFCFVFFHSLNMGKWRIQSLTVNFLSVGSNKHRLALSDIQWDFFLFLLLGILSFVLIKFLLDLEFNIILVFSGLDTINHSLQSCWVHFFLLNN